MNLSFAVFSSNTVEIILNCITMSLVIVSYNLYWLVKETEPLAKRLPSWDTRMECLGNAINNLISKRGVDVFCFQETDELAVQMLVDHCQIGKSYAIKGFGLEGDVYSTQLNQQIVFLVSKSVDIKISDSFLLHRSGVMAIPRHEYTNYNKTTSIIESNDWYIKPLFLEATIDGENFLFVGIHLRSRRNKFNWLLRQKQADEIIKYIKNTFDWENLHLVFVGDFNDNDSTLLHPMDLGHSTAIANLRESFYLKNMWEKDNSFKKSTTYQYGMDLEPSSKFNANVLDHILVSEKLFDKAEKFEALTEIPWGKSTGCSDHLGIVAHFKL